MAADTVPDSDLQHSDTHDHHKKVTEEDLPISHQSISELHQAQALEPSNSFSSNPQLESISNHQTEPCQLPHPSASSIPTSSTCPQESMKSKEISNPTDPASHEDSSHLRSSTPSQERLVQKAPAQDETSDCPEPLQAQEYLSSQEQKGSQTSQNISNPITPPSFTDRASSLPDVLSTPHLESLPSSQDQSAPSPSQPQGPSFQSRLQEQTDERWWLKKILWPPFPVHGSRPQPISIIMQNINGPCSLLAISNILLLRGLIRLPGPPERDSISFESLSSILADFLVRNSSHSNHLSTALSVIPSTRTGLNLNPRFGSIDGFGPGSGEHALFSSASVSLVHGWVADSQDTETWDVLVGKCGDYDKAVERMVIGEELFEKSQRVTSTQDMSREEREIIQDAFVIRRFLDGSSTQLSYSGLFQLASSLRPDSLAALFRNSHLSVLYRRPLITRPPPTPPPPPLPPPPDQMDADYSHETVLEVHAIAQSLAQVDLQELPSQQDDDRVPKLFSLVTDMSFLNEPHIVWESLEDIEGGLSEFYDWDLTRSRLKQPRGGERHRDSTGPSNNAARPNSHQVTPPDHLETDLLCAQQLQDEEYRIEAEARRSQHPPRPPTHPHQYPTQPQSSSFLTNQQHQSYPSAPTGHQSATHQAPQTSLSSTSATPLGRRSSLKGGKKKKDCTIM